MIFGWPIDATLLIFLQDRRISGGIDSSECPQFFALDIQSSVSRLNNNFYLLRLIFADIVSDINRLFRSFVYALLSVALTTLLSEEFFLLGPYSSCAGCFKKNFHCTTNKSINVKVLKFFSLTSPTKIVDVLTATVTVFPLCCHINRDSLSSLLSYQP